MPEERIDPEQLRRLTGVDRLPEVVDPAALRQAVDRHYPPELRTARVSGSALVDVRVDEMGRVVSVTPMERPAGIRAVMILENRDGTQRRVTPDDHPAFQAAAVAALREVAFSPALRDGQAVELTMRMTVVFDAPADFTT